MVALEERLMHDGHRVVNLAKYSNKLSYLSLWGQAGTLRQNIRLYHREPEFEDGYHLVCHSQGALLCRAVLESMDDHRVHAFVSLSGPQMGYYGNRESVWVNDWTREYVWLFAYGTLTNRLVGAASYWHDPRHEDTFRSDTWLFPYLNNLYDHGQNADYTDNFLRARRVYFFGSPDDGDIEPWQSALMGFYDANEHVVGVRDQDIFQKDTFGLRNMHERGDLVICAAPGAAHSDWLRSETLYERYLWPALNGHTRFLPQQCPAPWSLLPPAGVASQ